MADGGEKGRYRRRDTAAYRIPRKNPFSFFCFFLVFRFICSEMQNIYRKYSAVQRKQPIREKIQQVANNTLGLFVVDFYLFFIYFLDSARERLSLSGRRFRSCSCESANA